jgi:hypothetical protein
VKGSYELRALGEDLLELGGLLNLGLGNERSSYERQNCGDCEHKRTREEL